MDLQRTAGILLIAGFVFLVIGGITAPPRVYQESDLKVRLEIINKHQSRWFATNGVGALGALATGAGFLLLGVYLWESQNQTLLFLGAAASVISAIAVAIQSYFRAVDPAAHIADVSSLDRIWLGLVLAGGFFFGYLFLQAGYPSWLSYLLMGGATLLGIAHVVVNAAAAEVVYLVTVVAGIVLLRNPLP